MRRYFVNVCESNLLSLHNSAPVPVTLTPVGLPAGGAGAASRVVRRHTPSALIWAIVPGTDCGEHLSSPPCDPLDCELLGARDLGIPGVPLRMGHSTRTQSVFVEEWRDAMCTPFLSIESPKARAVVTQSCLLNNQWISRLGCK